MSGLFRRENLPQPESYYTGQGLTLKGSGAERKALCPFHTEKNPSFCVNIETGKFFCHACGRGGGDVLDFHIERHRLDFVQAAKDLGAWAGNGQAADSPDVIAARQQWEREQAERAKERDEREAKERAVAAEKALRIFKAAEPAKEDNPYLVRQGIKPTDTLRELQVEQAAAILGYHPKANDELLQGRLLVVPVKVDNDLSTVEMIDGDKRKSAVWNGKKRGGWWPTSAGASRQRPCHGPLQLNC